MLDINWKNLCVILCAIVFSQSLYSSEDKEVERLHAQLFQAQEDTTRVNILIELASKTNWSDIKSSEEYAKQALNISQQINYTKGVAYATFWLAKVFTDYEYDLSEKLAFQALELAKEINDSILIASVYNQLGSLKNYLNQNEDALVYYNKSLGIYLRHDQDSLAAASYSNLGILHSRIPDDTSCISYFQKAAEINKITKNYLWLSVNYMNMGYIYMEFNKLQEGFEHLQISLEIAEEHNFNRSYPWIYANLSSYYLKTENFWKFLEYANKTLLLAREQNNRLVELNILTKLKEAYNNMGQIKEVNHYLEQISIVKDSINKHNRLKELDLLTLRYKFEEDRKQLELQQILLKNKHQQKELIYALIILGTGLVVIIFIFLFIQQQNRIRRKSLEQKATLLEKEKLSNELDYKKKELTTSVMYTIEKNKALSGIIEELFEIEDTAVKEETQEAIQKISKKIKKTIDSEAWEEFEIRFQQVHSDFYDKLAISYPKLTTNEKRLCAFLRLDMSSKEISRITGQSISALELARTRLRKKLNISNTDINLITFLSQF